MTMLGKPLKNANKMPEFMLLELADYSRYFALSIGALQVLEGIFR